MARKIQNSQSVSRKRLPVLIVQHDQVRQLFRRQGEMRQDDVPVAPAYYVGHQKGTRRLDAFDLYNLTQEIPGYVQGSTVSGRTLLAAGFRLPPCVPNDDHERVVAQIDVLRKRFVL